MCSCIKDTVAWLHLEGVCFQGGVSDRAEKYIWQIVTIQGNFKKLFYGSFPILSLKCVVALGNGDRHGGAGERGCVVIWQCPGFLS